MHACACMCIKRVTDNKEVFEAWVEKALWLRVSRRGSGSDSRRAGGAQDAEGEGVKNLIEERRCTLLVFPPSYSPDSSPIEEAFSKIKHLVRKAGKRTQEALNEAIA